MPDRIQGEGGAPVVFGVVREARGLQAVVGTRRDGGYACERVALGSLPTGERRRLSLLERAWRHLEERPAWDAATLSAVLRVLMGTVPGEPCVAPDLPAPTAPAESTAAHPRAYRGTLRRPPKPAGQRPPDLRPYTCDPRALRLLLTRFSDHHAAALERLGREGVDGSRLDFNAADVGSAFQHGSGRFHDLPLAFRASLLLALRDAPWTEVEAALGAWWALGLAENHALRAALLHLVATRGASWRQAVVERPPSRRLALAEGALANALESPPLDALRELDPLVSDGRYPAALGMLLEALGRGVSQGYLMDGFRLELRLGKSVVRRPVGDCPDFPLEAVTRLLEGTGRVPWRASPMFLWDSCGGQPGFGDLIRRTPWHRVGPHHAARWLAIFCYSDQWATVSELAPDVQEAVLTAPESHRDRLLDLLYSTLTLDTSEILPVPAVRDFIKLCLRLCQPPWPPAPACLNALDSLVLPAPKPVREVLLEAPDAPFARLEEACERTNDSFLIERDCTA